ncbi:Kallikrein-4 [Manis pentadactyla]|nr:Kallikrein-4 [Manis pentadactyla]
MGLSAKFRIDSVPAAPLSDNTNLLASVQQRGAYVSGLLRHPTWLCFLRNTLGLGFSADLAHSPGYQPHPAANKAQEPHHSLALISISSWKTPN